MKLKSKKNIKSTLSDKIADALTLKPRADIEDDEVFGTKPRTVTRVDLGSSDSEEEANISDFRKQNVNLLSQVSKKYEGQVISRTVLKESDHPSDESDEDRTGKKKVTVSKESIIHSEDSLIHSEDEESVGTPQKNLLQKCNSEDFESDVESDDYSITKSRQISQIESDDDNESDADEGYDISQMEELMKEDFEHVKKQNISEETKKGISVRNQLLLWEGLLELRINLQKCMNTANQMPMLETNKVLKENHEFLEVTNIAKANVATVLDKLLNLQNFLFKNYPETKSLLTKQQGEIEKKEQDEGGSDEEIPSDTDNEEIPSDTEEDEQKEHTNTKKKNTNEKKRKLQDYEQEISNTHKVFKSFRDTTIQKWNDKTRLATATSIKTAPTNTILQQISYILSDKDKLIHRTQLKRSEYDIIGYKKENKEQDLKETNDPRMKERKDNDEYIPEIFDDSDFYHQLLRELIECKSSDISDPVQLSRQWIALQQMRSKMKRKVDTKATKGRKIKYAIHNQLVNYMAPVKCTGWTNESANELYSSLFGKMFEHNNVGLNGDVENNFKLTK